MNDPNSSGTFSACCMYKMSQVNSRKFDENRMKNKTEFSLFFKL